MVNAEEGELAQHIGQLFRFGSQTSPGMNKAHVVHIYVDATTIQLRRIDWSANKTAIASLEHIS